MAILVSAIFFVASTFVREVILEPILHPETVHKNVQHDDRNDYDGVNRPDFRPAKRDYIPWYRIAPHKVVQVADDDDDGYYYNGDDVVQCDPPAVDDEGTYYNQDSGTYVTNDDEEDNMYPQMWSGPTYNSTETSYLSSVPTPDYAQAIFNKLVNTAEDNPVPGDHFNNAQDLKLVIADDSRINAYSMSDGTIYINKGTLHFEQGYPDQLAFDMGHEIGHWVLGHTTGHGHPGAGDKRDETAADMYGKALETRAGFNGCQASVHWQRLIGLYGNADGGPRARHPDFQTRANYLKCSTLDAASAYIKQSVRPAL